MSITKVIAAAFVPPVRNILVVPILPEPLARGFGVLKSLETMIPVGIEPRV